MLTFNSIDVKTFLQDYWQQKPCIIRNAWPNFKQPLTADELAGLALESDVESRIVIQTPGVFPYWQLRHGPFSEDDFVNLPATHWTLLVQGVDRLVPEIALLWEYFNFLPQWRIDDVMISYAVKEGSVGPHYDNYDVFLLQANGYRKWSLTQQKCIPSNCLPNLDLRIMAEFIVEEEYILAPGDILYLPPNVGHHGIALDNDCITYSFGYRSYQTQELLNSFTDYLAEQPITSFYRDPDWSYCLSTASIPQQAWLNARDALQQFLHDEQLLSKWFAHFATALNPSIEQDLPEILDEHQSLHLVDFIAQLRISKGLIRDACCRFAYLEKSIPSLQQNDGELQLFINGCEWAIENVSVDLIKLIATKRFLPIDNLKPLIDCNNNQVFLHELWQLQWLVLVKTEDLA